MATTVTSRVSRDVVLAAADGLREATPSTASEEALDTAVRAVVAAAGGPATDDIDAYTAYPASPGGHVDGLLVDVRVRTSDGVRSTTVAAFAATDPTTQLSGTADLRGAAPASDDAPRSLDTTPLSGDAVVTGPVDTSSLGVLEVVATGVVTGPADEDPDPAPSPTPDPTAPTPTRVPRTAAEKQAARATYDRAVAAARRSYQRALKKAKGRRQKKAAAKATYARRKAAALAAYRAAIADVVTSAAPSAPATTAPPAGPAFSVTISTDAGWNTAS